MSVLIAGNIVDGDINVEARLLEESLFDIAFTNNRVTGDVNIISSDLCKTVFVNNCDIDNSLKYMSQEVWFMYHNVFIDKIDVNRVLKAYSNGVVTKLRFNVEHKPAGVFDSRTMGVVVICLEFLKKYTIQECQMH